MTYKTILIKADREARFARTAGTALAIASHFGSHLICFGPAQGFPAVGLDASPHSGDQTALVAEAQRMRAHLERESRASRTSWEWVEASAADKSGSSAVARAHAADLIVVAAPDADGERPHTGPSVEDLVLSSGRPVMQVPRGWGSFYLGGTILIAWNGSREVAWSTFAAMPLLKAARSVKLLYVAREEGEDTNGSLILESRKEMGRTLGRHGVRAVGEEIALSIPEVGAALVSAAKAESAELIVMGGSGQARSGQLLLGRTTRHMLKHSGVPLLMSH